MPGVLSRRLGLAGGPGLLRAFGLRELVAGLVILARPAGASGPASRVAGDAMDVAVLAHACRRANPNRAAAAMALALVAGVTALDILCTARLAAGRRAQSGVVS